MSIVYGQFGAVDVEDNVKTLIVFNCNCNFDYNTFYKPPKITIIIIYILYVHENVSTILFQEIQIHEFGYVIILFESYRISFFHQDSTSVLRHS